MARIELEPDGFGLLLNDPDRELIVAELKGLGYRYVALDLEGFRSGSMNEGADTAPSRLAVADIPDYHQSVSSNRRETDSSLESR